MRKDLHEDPKFKEWQETINRDLQRIVESDNTKSYEKIFTELGGLEVPNSTDCSDKLENLIKQVVDQKLCKFESQMNLSRNAYKILVENGSTRRTKCR
jgi:hypothetical protein